MVRKKKKIRRNKKKSRKAKSKKIRRIKSKKKRSQIYKTRKKIIKNTEKELAIKTTKDWIKKSYVNKKTYEKKYDLSIKNNEAFWKKEGKRITWIKPYTKVKDIKYWK